MNKDNKKQSNLGKYLLAGLESGGAIAMGHTMIIYMSNALKRPSGNDILGVFTTAFLTAGLAYYAVKNIKQIIKSKDIER